MDLTQVLNGIARSVAPLGLKRPESREQRAESREQRAESREQRAESRATRADQRRVMREESSRAAECVIRNTSCSGVLWYPSVETPFEAVRLASKERVQQRPPLGLRAADGGSVEGSAEDIVSSGIQERTVEQIVDRCSRSGFSKFPRSPCLLGSELGLHRIRGRRVLW